MKGRLQVRRVGKSRSPLWLWPAAGGAIGLASGLLLVRVPLAENLDWLAWPGSADSATALLQTVVASVITVLTLTFTLTVVALQLASQQFSPRLLRDFTRDRVLKGVLTVLVGTLVFTATVLRGVNAGPLPDVALLVASALAMASVAAVLGFLTHMTRVLRVDTMMRTVHDETDAAIAAFYPVYGDPRPRSPQDLHTDRAHETVLPAPRSGFVQTVDVAALLATAREHDALIIIDARPGDHVVEGTPLATVWPTARSGPALPVEALHGAVDAAVHIGYERTIDQDAAFGFRQLTDIAVKAISPGINDPVTAAHAVGHMADLLVKLLGRRLGPILHDDDAGVGRVVVPDRDLPYYLDLVCGPIRRYGRSEPTVLTALLRMLRDAATAARDDHHHRHIEEQVDLIVGELAPEINRHDTAQVTAMADRVRQALKGDVTTAYRDRSGETRSL